MWSALIILFFFVVTSTQANILKQNELGFKVNRSDVRLGGYYVLDSDDQAEYDQLKFIAYIKEIAGDTQIGNGIILNDFWVLTVTSVVSAYTFDQILVVICANPIQIQGLNREVRAIENNIDCATEPLEACVSLLRVCPSISSDHFPPIAPSLTGYRDVTRVMHLYRHINSGGEIIMHRGVKLIGELCECMDILDWNLDTHVCLAEDVSVFAEAGDMKTIVVTNEDRSEVVGFLIVEQTSGFGEIVLHIEAVRDFIDSTALVAPYQYPL